MSHFHPLRVLLRGPRARVYFHTTASWAWLITMVVVPCLGAFHGAAQLPALLIMEVSLYANFATEFGAIDAARASVQTSEKDGV